MPPSPTSSPWSARCVTQNHQRAMFCVAKHSNSQGPPHFAQASPTRVIYNGDMKTGKKKKRGVKTRALWEMNREENLALPVDTLHILKTTLWQQSGGRIDSKEWEATLAARHNCLSWGAEHISSAHNRIKREWHPLKSQKRVSCAFPKFLQKNRGWQDH